MDVVSRVRTSLMALAGGALMVLVGCSGYVNRGQALYANGHYIEAAQAFEYTEERLPESTPREQAEYGIYRGLTLLVLGDYHGAERWFEYASEVEGKAPGTLRPQTRDLLARGWSELEVKRSTVPALSSPPNTAVAASQPAAPITPQRD